MATMPYLDSLPEHATYADLREAYAALLDELRPFAQRLMRGPSPLTVAERELIAAFVSGLNSCSYCYGTHARVAAAFGIEEITLAALLEDVEQAAVEPRLKPVLRFVRKLTLTPSRTTRADADAVRAAGFGDEGLMHAVAVCAYFNQMNRLLDGTGIRGEAHEHAGAARRLIDAGYDTAGVRKRGTGC